MEEKRKVTRVVWESPITLKRSDNEVVKGEVKNLSFKGALVELKNFDFVQLNETVHFSISLCDSGIEFIIEGDAKAVRKTENMEVAIAFTHLEVDAVTHLRQLVTLNNGDPEKIDNEFWEMFKV